MDSMSYSSLCVGAPRYELTVCCKSKCVFEQCCLTILAERSPVTISDLFLYCKTAISLHIHCTTSKANPSCFGCLLQFSYQLETCDLLHKYILKALRYCYEFGLKPDKNGLPQKLMYEIQFCVKDLSMLFTFLEKTSFSGSAENILFPDGSRNVEESLKALEYYLCLTDFSENVTNICMNRSFSYFTSCLPLNTAVFSLNPEAILLLLQYGADPLLTCLEPSTKNCLRESPLTNLVAALNSLEFVRSRCLTTKDFDMVQKEFEKVLLCLEYMRRATCFLPIISSDSLASKNCSILEQSVTKKPTVINEFWLVLNSSRIIGLPSLKDQCRCAIRRSISNSNTFHIPMAIQKLPLPQRLKDYLNLCY